MTGDEAQREAARQRELLVDCYLSEQMSEAQWHAHTLIEPELLVLLARRRGEGATWAA